MGTLNNINYNNNSNNNNNNFNNDNDYNNVDDKHCTTSQNKLISLNTIK